MSAAQARFYRDLSGKYCAPFSEGLLSFEALFQNANPVVCEIGFGMGDSTVAIAEANPDKNYLGIEVYKAGIGRLLGELERRDIRNVRVIEHDAVEALRWMVADSSVAGFHIFFPDPWPKRRQHKRRLVRRPFTDMLAHKLTPGGYVFFVTDWDEYGRWALDELSQTEHLHNICEGSGGFAPSQAWKPETKFEARGRAQGRAIREVLFRKGVG
ncbi:MAG: tRNA (guanosine(46)-N7)-methyltransferase TrmB [Spirochaetaceae bacterium]|jgi:tRNA (guanine-N7-)-methyltransferase|nr:tRNA (guanosine(46)-N7)-methyltransferase TrmB [Spirochaetaceae bacterium]